MIDRRQLGLAGLGLAVAATQAGRALGQAASIGASAGAQRSMIAGVNLGIQSYTFGRGPIDEIIPAVAQAGFGLVELHMYNMEPNFPVPPRTRGAPGAPPASLGAAAQAWAKQARDQQIAWRTTVPLDYFADVARGFREQGVTIGSNSFGYGGNLTDKELELTLLATKAMGTDLMTAVGGVEVLPKLDALAKLHDVRIALHNGGVLNTGVEAFEAGLKGRSDRVGFCLDAGHFFAGGGDPIAMMQKNRDRIFCMHIKDRVKNNGPVRLLGEGDTPVVEVLRWMRDNRFQVPIYIEQEVAGWDRMGIAKHDLEYCRKALLT
jgi:sugar phosphate isomerase/epimerase